MGVRGVVRVWVEAGCGWRGAGGGVRVAGCGWSPPSETARVTSSRRSAKRWALRSAVSGSPLTMKASMPPKVCLAELELGPPDVKTRLASSWSGWEGRPG